MIRLPSHRPTITLVCNSHTYTAFLMDNNVTKGSTLIYNMLSIVFNHTQIHMTGGCIYRNENIKNLMHIHGATFTNRD